MNSLQIHTNQPVEVTMVSNSFIDREMIKANGEFVKIYIYLLRCMGTSCMPSSIADIADIFGHTEADILRALKYWETRSLLSIEYDKNQQVTGLCLTPSAESKKKEEPGITTAASVRSETSVTIDQLSISAERLDQLKADEEAVQLLFIAEQYLGKTLTSTEMSTILYFYDELNMSADLIEYLIEYCIGRGSKSIRYIQTVGLAWSMDGIHTVSQAKKNSQMYNRKYYTILNAFGIKGRNPAEAEITIMNTWINEYGFDMELILEACSRTINQTHQPSFKYADKILADWKKKGVHHKADILALDQKHLQRKQTTQRPKPPAQNKFNNFHQRDYDYSQLEKQLLGSNQE